MPREYSPWKCKFPNHKDFPNPDSVASPRDLQIGTVSVDSRINRSGGQCRGITAPEAGRGEEAAGTAGPRNPAWWPSDQKSARSSSVGGTYAQEYQVHVALHPFLRSTALQLKKGAPRPHPWEYNWHCR
uniref:Uncharacterized protein n=1 Tax=Myotis myotis TaxID=51298 RepID=A0A7J7XZW7_MYOMY|nr:hypothetical protein mMyoMyo1_011420 [Myotis myotis]